MRVFTKKNLEIRQMYKIKFHFSYTCLNISFGLFWDFIRKNYYFPTFLNATNYYRIKLIVFNGQFFGELPKFFKNIFDDKNRNYFRLLPKFYWASKGGNQRITFLSPTLHLFWRLEVFWCKIHYYRLEPVFEDM